MKKYFYLILCGMVLFFSCIIPYTEPEVPVEKLYIGEPLEDWVIYYRIGAPSADKIVKFSPFHDMLNEINEPYKDVIFFDPKNPDEISLFEILTLNSGYEETLLYLGSRDASKKESDKKHDCHFTLKFADGYDTYYEHDYVFEGSGFYDTITSDKLGTYYKNLVSDQFLRVFGSYKDQDIVLTYDNKKYTVGSKIALFRRNPNYDDIDIFVHKDYEIKYDTDFNGELKNNIFTYFPLFTEFYGLDKDSRRFNDFCRDNDIKIDTSKVIDPFDLYIPENSSWYGKKADNKFDNIYLSGVFKTSECRNYRFYGKVR